MLDNSRTWRIEELEIYLVSFFLVQLKLEEETVHFVDKQDRLDALSEGLSKHSLGLHAYTLDAVHHHESSVSNT